MTTAMIPANGDTPSVGGLFAGLSFFLVQRLPSRSLYISKIQSNGGRVVKLETQADHIIADHVRKDCPLGSISYKFIDAALRDGKLPDPDNHAAAAPQGLREVGSALPQRITRTPFTAEDDHVLWNWVERSKAHGGLPKGNEIYKQLEAWNPRHSFQAWRDRYIKKLMDRPPARLAVTIPANPPPTPPSAPDQEDGPPASETPREPIVATPRKRKAQQMRDQDGEVEEIGPGFTDADVELLLNQAEDIEMIADERLNEAWSAWEETHNEHTGEEWRAFYQSKVRPLYLEQQAEKKAWKRRREAWKASIRKGETRNAANGANAEIENGASKATHAELAKDTQIRPDSVSQDIRKDEVPPLKSHGLNDRKKRETANSDLIVSEKTKGEERIAGRSPLEPQPADRLPAEITELCSNDEDGVDMTAAKGHIPTLIRNHGSQALSSLDMAEKLGDRKKVQGVDMSNLPTSDANRAADQQVRWESLEQDYAHDKDGLSPRVISALPTSDANRAADQQLRRESLHRQDDDYEVEDGQEADNATLSHNNQLVDEQARYAATKSHANFVLLADPNEVGRGQDILREGTEVIVEQPTGDALTESNLASQQAQHKAQHLRGSDLPEDDEDEDQTNFLQFLQGVTGQHMDLLPPANSVTATQRGALEGMQPWSDSHLDMTQYTTNEGFLPNSFQFHTTLAPRLPMSSQQELEDALLENVQWPLSPQASQKKQLGRSESQSLRLETQIADPSLPNRTAQGSDKPLSSKLFQPSNVQYHALPDQARIAFPSRVNAQSFPSQPSSEMSEHSDMFIDHPDIPEATGELPNGENDMGVTVPEPEGGRHLLSSHGRPDAKHSPPSLPTLEDNVEADEHGNAQDDMQRDGEPDSGNLVNVSSTSPLSLSYGRSGTFVSCPEHLTTSKSKMLDTQDILNAESQQPDLDMPLPPDSDDDEEDGRPEDLLKVPSPTTKIFTTVSKGDRRRQRINVAETQTLDDDDVDAYITTLIVRRGYDENSIIRALKASSMRPELAELILAEEKAGRGRPNDVAGIWTEEEDMVVEGGDARKMREVDRKHGWDELLARQRWLEDYRECE